MVVFAVAVGASAYAKDITWHQGTVVLTDREVVVGEIARMSFDLLLYRSADGTVTSYPAHKVKSFRYYDEAEDINRNFVSVARKSGSQKTYKYYESVVSGKISVLRIQHFFAQSIDETQPGNFSFYIAQEHVVRPMRSFRRKFFPKICQELDDKLISHRGLDPNTKYGVLSLIMLYNQAPI